MTLCNYWNCSQNSLGDEEVCRVHLQKLEYDLLDLCPSCNLLLKSSDELECGECANWGHFIDDPYMYGGDDFADEDALYGRIVKKSMARRAPRARREFA